MHIKSVIKTLFVILLVFAQGMAVADPEEDGAIWFNINAQGKLPIEHLNWYAEFQPRWREEGDHFDLLILRPAIFYKLSAKSSIWAGYANVKSYPAGRTKFEEDRLWQQFLYTFDPIKGINLQSRTRLEQRNLEGGNDTGHRLRQMVRATKPLAGYSTVSLVAWDEFFLHLNDTDWGARQGYDQNRLFVGASWAIKPKAFLEVGYLNQYVNVRGADKMNHALSTTLYLNF
jgi:hypothetical protein